MNAFTSTLKSLLKREIWGILAFIIPLLLRSIPEILAWPYPIGNDTISTISHIRSGQVLLSGPIVFVQYHLVYAFETLAYWLTGNVFVVLDVFGPLLMGAVAIMGYLYAKRGLNWSPSKSFLVALLIGTYFVSLRNSWDLYAQSFGLIFLFALLVIFKTYTSSWKYPAMLGFMILTVLSHELVAVILFFIMALEAARFLFKGPRRDFVYLFTFLALSFSLFLYIHYSPQNGVVIPTITAGSGPSVALSLDIIGFLVYCFALILPLAIVGFRDVKDRILKYWILLCAGVPLLQMAITTSSLYFWDRWVLLLVYPMLFFAVNGLEKLWRLRPNIDLKNFRPIAKVVVVAYLILLFSLSGFYLAANSQNQTAYFSGFNHYSAYIPSSMQENTLPVGDNPGLFKCFNWINDNTPQSSIIIEHFQLCEWTALYVKRQVTVLGDPNAIQNDSLLANVMIATAENAAFNGSSVYTVWWVNGEGWYQIFPLPTNFQQVYQFGRIGVFIYNATT